eukprot:375777-Amphidinium_carterae.1
MKAPAQPSNPAPIMKPPPQHPNAPMELAKVQPTHADKGTQRGFKPPPAHVQRPGFKGPPEGIVVPPWQPANPVVTSSSPAGVKTPFKGPPKNHPDYKGGEVPITYLPYTPQVVGKKPPPQMMPKDKLFKPPPAPGYGGLTRDDHAIAQAAYEQELANRRA